jgi:hypothetical protein
MPSGAVKQLAAKVGGDDLPYTTGLHARYDASAISASNNDTLSTWADLSGNGRTATAPSGQEPRFLTNVLNGRPVVSFKASATKRMATESWTALSQPNTIIFVGKADSGQTFSVLFDGISSNNRHYVSRNNSATQLLFFAGEAQALSVNMETAKIMSVLFNFNSSRVRLNGGSATNGTFGIHTLTGLMLGNRHASDFFSCDYIAELLLYDHNVAVADLNDIGNYLGTKWGITWTTAT